MLRYTEAIADARNKGFCWVFGSFFARVLPRQTEKIWNRLGILMPTHLAPEFWRLYYHWIWALEKPDVQNIAACENQSKERESEWSLIFTNSFKSFPRE